MESKTWLQQGLELLKHTTRIRVEPNDSNLRTFRQNFGCSPLVAMKCWYLLEDHPMIKKAKYIKPVHLLWACLFLKVYAKESTHASLAKVTDKTFRTWAWKIIHALSDLEDVVVC